MFAFIVWSSLAAPLPLFALSFLVEGSAAVATLLHPSLLVLVCALFLAGPAQLFGFGIWSRLLSQHSAAAVTPFALLVPVVGMINAALWFGEPASTMEWIGGAFILAGLATSVLGERLVSFARA
jgi:O-acetylserine/cysteine efflux transporter